MIKLFIFAFCLLFWCYLFRMFHKLNMIAFKFFTGSIGFFLITLIFFNKYLEIILNKILFFLLNLITNLTNLFGSFSDVNTVLINTNTGIISMNLTYECSGVIEILVFISLALFFPFRTRLKKLLLTISGFFALVIANVLRIMFIASISKVFGIESYLLTHIFFARILFFILTISIYYVIFTKVHLKEYIFGGVTIEQSH
ncbi:MAG: exosortase family protein XrtG [Sarcina sp.]